MGKPVRPVLVKLIIGMISAEEELFARLEELLAGKFGPVDLKSGIFPFDFTAYYEPEMGKNLKREFIAFARLIEPDRLARIKLFTTALEKKFSLEGKRRINLDPGYISGGKLVLATVKNGQHRICVGKGVYEEITLRFRKGEFQPWEWTYPDYRTEGYLNFFSRARKIYLCARQKQ